MDRITYLSFWDVELSNLPVGTFRRRTLSMVEARSMIEAARSSGTLVCVAKDDLGAPYCEHARERHEQLCTVLRDHADVEIQLKDFFGRDCANPLCGAEVGEQGDMMVIDCSYAIEVAAPADAPSAGVTSPAEPSAHPRRDIDALGIKMVPGSIAFNLFEHIENGAKASDASI